MRPPIVFRDGLNVVLGEIRHPEDRDEDTHNLGKILLAQTIDFCLPKEKRKEHFLVKHAELLQGLAFHLEVETKAGTFVTIRRGVDTASEASFKVHDSPNQDFTKLAEDEWTHWQLPFQRAVQALDGYLALTAIAPWSFRKIIGYSLRTQRDYDQPFKLSKFGGKHAEWKPLLAHVIGLDSAPISRSYEIIDRLADLATDEKRLAREVSGVAESADQLRGRLRLQEEAMEQVERSVEAYNFEVADAEINQDLVDRIDADTAELNERRYYLASHLDRIKASQGDRITADFAAIRSIFEQAEIYFHEALVKQYSDLEAFTRAITAERDLSDPLIARPFVRLGHYRQRVFSRYRLQRKHLWFFLRMHDEMSMASKQSRGPADRGLGEDRAENFIASLFADDLHAKRVLSLSNAVVGVLRSASL
ncbi:MAG: hypothetical protein V3V08_13250, partial [Nannocystaceae bacterium]